MLRNSLLSAMILIVSALAALAATSKTYETARILDLEQKAHERVLYYLVNTPVTQDDPYYEITLQLKDTIYTGEYTPRHAADTLPAEWITDAPVKVRMEKHSMFLKSPGGDDLQFAITGHKPAGAVPKPAGPETKP
ncbi:MAG TPA: hypothetical protein VMH85_15540 [Terriglobales bacterium]|nr:hypothetical protein [Terriglobales bacterium]